MKRLLVLRHAKSSRADASLEDWHRPLNDRGREDAPRVGEWLRERPVQPDLILTSDAVRARSTAQAVAKVIGITKEIVQEPGLYLAKPADIIDILAATPVDAQTVMIVGHNPGLEELVQQLTGDHIGLVTAALVDLEIPIEHWSQLQNEPTASIVDRWQPRD